MLRRIVVSLIPALLWAASVAAQDRLTLGYGDNTMSAASLKVLQTAYARIGVTVDGRLMPSARSLEQANRGMTDGEVMRIAAVSEESPDLIRIDVPVNTVEGILLTCRAYLEQVSLDKARELRVGIRIGNRYAEMLTKGFPHVTRLPHMDNLLDLLLAGRLDAVLVDRYWAMTRMEQPEGEALLINDPPLAVIPLYHYLHRRRADLVPAITAELQAMRDSGEIDRILNEFKGR